MGKTDDTELLTISSPILSPNSSHTSFPNNPSSNATSSTTSSREHSVHKNILTDHLLAPDLSLEIGHATLKGLYHPNEDRVSTYLDLRTYADYFLPHQLSLLLLTDGHDGAQCSMFIQVHFVSIFLHQIKEQCDNTMSVSTSFTNRTITTSDFVLDDTINFTKCHIDFSVALRNTFFVLEEEWKSHVARIRTSRNYASINGFTSGACCTAVVLYDQHVVVANVGDARCVLRKQDNTLEILTTDHRCQNEDESKRILSLGGFIRNNRVLGILEPTRTIGDLEEKEKTTPGVISADPTIHEYTLQYDNDIFTTDIFELAINQLVKDTNKYNSTHLTRPVPLASSLNPGKRFKSVSSRSISAGPSLAKNSNFNKSSVNLLHNNSNNNNTISQVTSKYTPTALQMKYANRYNNNQSSYTSSITAPTSTPKVDRSQRSISSQLNNTMDQNGLSNTIGRNTQSLDLISIPRTPIYTFTVPEAINLTSKLPFTCIIVASDGVWDVLTSLGATAIVSYAYILYKDVTAAAQELCRMAQRIGSTDDITVAVMIIRK